MFNSKGLQENKALHIVYLQQSAILLENNSIFLEWGQENY